MSFDVLFSGVPVADFDAAVAWYERLLGQPADAVAHDTEVMWRITDGGWLYVIRDPGRAGHAIVAIAVPDLDEMVGRIEQRGISPLSIEPVGDAGRKASFSDPEGNTVAFIEVSR
jgi:predicted enzyme related to lactoylglutathione lyase